jgi:hypothetical protein
MRNVANTQQFGTDVIHQNCSEEVHGLLLATDQIHKLMTSSIYSFQQGETRCRCSKIHSTTHCLFSFPFMLIPCIRALLRTLTLAQAVKKSSSLVRHNAYPYSQTPQLIHSTLFYSASLKLILVLSSYLLLYLSSLFPSGFTIT